MAHPIPFPSMTEMTDIFLEGVTCPYNIYVAESKLPEAGFGLFAGKEIPAGTELFRAMPAVSAVRSSVDACDNCFVWASPRDPFKPPVNLLTCASCKMMKYCSKGCQRAAWKRYHKQECGIYQEIDPQIWEPKENSLAIRMLLRLIVLHQHGQLTGNHWKAISALKSNKELMGEPEELDLPAINAKIRLLKEVAKSDMSEGDLQDLYWRINFNRHSVDSPLQPPLGSCLVPSATLINHSCEPNAHHLSEGPELVVRSIRKIAKNEEITISYIDTILSFEERQEALATTYAFICLCCRCTKRFEEQEDFLTGDAVLDTQIYNAKSKLYTLFNSLADGAEELVGVEAKMREICSASGKPWPLNASPLPKLFERLAGMLQTEQQWEKALQLWLKIVYIIDPLCYPERLNPHRVTHLLELCQMEAQISQMSQIDDGIKASFHTIERAMTMAQYHHNIQLQQDAAASLGTKHVIFRSAAHYVEAMDTMMMTQLGVSPTDWHSEQFKQAQKEIFKSNELKLLKWTDIDLTSKTI